MQRKLTKILCVVVLAGMAAACVSKETTWYEQRCHKIGLKKGTADFDKCVARDKAWVEADQKKAASTKNR
jgi:hypothetical protein